MNEMVPKVKESRTKAMNKELSLRRCGHIVCFQALSLRDDLEIFTSRTGEMIWRSNAQCASVVVLKIGERLSRAKLKRQFLLFVFNVEDGNNCETEFIKGSTLTIYINGIKWGKFDVTRNNWGNALKVFSTFPSR